MIRINKNRTITILLIILLSTFLSCEKKENKNSKPIIKKDILMKKDPIKKVEKKKVLSDFVKLKYNPKKTDYEERDGLLYIKGEKLPYSGFLTMINSKTQKRYKLLYAEGKKFNGEKVKLRYDNNNKKVEVFYTDGRKTKDIVYYKDGEKGVESNYKDDKLDGKEIKWRNGKIISEVNYKDGKRDGKSTKWYIDGKIISKSNFKNDKRNGVETIFYPTGKIRSKVNYVDGKKEGKEIIFYQNEEKRSEVNYVDGKKEGKEIFLDKDGKIKSEILYKNGKKEEKSK